MITRGRAYMAEPVSGEMLKSVMEEYLRGSDRRRELRKAYENDRAILRRKRQEGMPNNRLAHGYPRYIVTMASGYLLGKPVDYQAAEGQEEALDRVLEAYDEADVQSVDAELAKDASIYGTGIEMIYADDEAKPKTAALDAESAFVVYDDTVENRPMLGVRFAEKRDISGTRTGWTVWAYTERAETRYTASELTGPYTQEEYRAHYFGGVPMVEYWNGEDEQGDFEGVMTLIDAYDTLESDRINDKEQFVDALLVLTGCRMETNENGETPGQQLRKEKLLYLPDSDAKAEYLCRSLTETDVEVLREALKTDIHKFSMVPEMTDQEFAGNASGVAMRYKLLGLEQLIRIKERWFREALREGCGCLRPSFR